MKAISKYILTAILATVLLGSCSKWLDVKPKDKFTEIQVFADLAGASNTLNGIYLQLSKEALYGGNLTMTTLEILAQRYNIGSSHSKVKFQTYGYAEDAVKNNFESIWQEAYVAIVNANQFIAGLDAYTAKDITPGQDSIMRGEALGLRAMMHFDLLRMFGPVYNSADSLKPSIPYYREAGATVMPLLPANAVIDSVLEDLRRAEQLLRNDPIITVGVEKTVVGDGKDFFRNRNMRMNYYAVKALEARVHLYRENKAAALSAATAVIEEGGKWFPWIDPTRIMSDRVNPDRVFSSELVFGLFNINLYSTYRNIYAPEVNDNTILAPNDTRLKAIYESNESDYRYNPMWILPSVGGKSYKTFYKYADVQSADSSFRYKMPMIRISEMYYIAAECEPDANRAKDYLNTVRYNRGLAAVASSANLNTELQKEYQKEFYGEGQLFFYYKRRKATSVPNSAATSGNVNPTAYYVWPLPLSETQYR